MSARRLRPDRRIFLTPGYGGNLKSYSIANGRLTLSTTANDLSYGNLSGSPMVSQNGTANSIVWALDRNTNTLRAYDATDLTKVLYTSAQAPLNRDQLAGLVTKFSVPTIADGIVFVGTSNAMLIYGPPIPPTAPPAAPSILAAVAPFPTQVVLNWTDNASNEDLFSVERSPDGNSGWTEIGQASANAQSFIDNSVSANSTYYYRVRAFNSFNGGSYSGYTNVASATATPFPTGTGDGLLASYYANPIFTGTPIHRVDPQLNFDWNFGSPDPAIPVDHFSAVWTGIIKVPLTGNYTFYTTSDDGVVVYISGQPIINNWSDHGATEDVSSLIALSSTTTYAIRVEYFEDGGLASLNLSWSSDQLPKALVPQSALYSGVAPPAPTNLTAAPASGTQINLAWTDNSSTETGFIIQRKDGTTGTYAQLTIVPPGTTSYQDTGLLANTTYFYQVLAANFVGNSPLSNEASATTPVPPATPSDAEPTAVTTNSIAFTWQDNSDNEDKFSIFRRIGDGSYIFIADVPANTTSFTNTGLQPGTLYDYHIQAWNLGGYTDFAGFTVTTVTTPPASPSATAGNGQVTLSWTAAPGAIGYNIYRGTSAGGEAAQPVATNITGVTYIDTGLINGPNYYYKITAITTGGESASSAEVSATPSGGDGLLGIYYSGPNFTGTTVKRVDPQVNFDWGSGSPIAGIPVDNFSVAWTGSIKPPTSGSYTFYTNTDDGVRLYVNGQQVINDWTDHGALEDASVPISLVGGQSYSIRMEYYDNQFLASAQLSWSGPQISKALVPQAVLFSAALPTAPTNLKATAGAGKVTLTWTAVTGATSYNIYRGTSAGGEAPQPIATGVTAATFVNTGLNTGGTYYYKITAVNAGGESIQTAEVSATPTGDGLLGTYYSGPNFTGTALQRIDAQVNFNWASSSPMTGIPTDNFSVVWSDSIKPATTGSYTFYTNSDDGVRLYVNGQLVINDWTSHSAKEDTSSAIAVDRWAELSYPAGILRRHRQSRRPIEWSSSQVAKAAIPQTVLFSSTVPAVPTNPTATPGDGQIALAWTTAPGALSFNIYRGTTPGGEAAQPVATGVPNASYIDTGLTNAAKYYYKITAVTASGESAPSAEVSATAGSGDGLLGTYYAGLNFTGTSIQRVDPQVNFDWGTGSPMTGIPVDKFSVVWTGNIKPTATANYTFYTSGDDGVRLYINGQLVINDWTTHNIKENTSLPISLVGGQSYAIRMEYFENTGKAAAQLRWSSPQIAKTLVPQAVLFSGTVVGQLMATATTSSKLSALVSPSTTSGAKTSTTTASPAVLGFHRGGFAQTCQPIGQCCQAGRRYFFRQHFGDQSKNRSDDRDSRRTVCEAILNQTSRLVASGLGQPVLRRFDLRGVEILDLGHRERHADFGHPFLPSLFANQGNPLDLRAMRCGELSVVPQRVQVPAVEVVELRQHANFALLGNRFIDKRHKGLVIFVVQLAGHFEAEHFVW